jgi:hypothetical protein
VRVARQRHVALAESRQQCVVQPADRTGRIAVPHLLVDRIGVDAAEQFLQLVRRIDAEFQQ